MKKYQLTVYCINAEICEGYTWVDLEDVELPTGLLSKLADLGIIDMRGRQVRADHIGRAYKALRLHRSLGVNYNGAAVILDLLDRIEQLSGELEQRKRQQ